MNIPRALKFPTNSAEKVARDNTLTIGGDMDIHNLSTAMANQAAASASTPGSLNVQKVADSGAQSPKSGGDTVDLSAEARAKAAVTGAAPAQSNSSNLTSRIAKLQKQLQQEQGSSNLPEDKKRSEIAELRNQIMMLQSQLPKSGSSSAGGTPASSLTTSHA